MSWQERFVRCALAPLIVRDLAVRELKSVEALSLGWVATENRPYPWDRMHWADSLAVELGYVVQASGEVHAL